MMNTWILLLLLFAAISAVGFGFMAFFRNKRDHRHPVYKKRLFTLFKRKGGKEDKAGGDDEGARYEKLHRELMLNEQAIRSNLVAIEQSDAFLTDLLKRIQTIQHSTHSSSTRSKINTVIELIHKQLNRDVRDGYEQLYTPSRSRFMDSLCCKHPNLTSMEQKLCMFLSMGLTTKEISDITMQNCRAIEMARHRLRSKLPLSRSDNIIEYLSGFENR